MQRPDDFLSVIVPCYRQEKTVVSSIKNLEQVLAGSSIKWEIIIVVDGNVDKTYHNVKKLSSSKIHAYAYDNNHGKGYALRYGISRAKGNIIAFIDGGNDLNPERMLMLLSHFYWYNADIIVGSKWHPVSIVSYPWWRKILSIGYGTLVRFLFRLRVRDTQLGMKLFKREVLIKVLPRLLVKKFAFDIEILAVAHRLGFTRIYEAPIELHWDDFDSSLSKNLPQSVWHMFVDTLAVFYRLYIVKYYDDGSKRKWRYDKELDFRVNVG